MFEYFCERVYTRDNEHAKWNRSALISCCLLNDEWILHNSIAVDEYRCASWNIRVNVTIDLCMKNANGRRSHGQEPRASHTRLPGPWTCTVQLPKNVASFEDSDKLCKGPSIVKVGFPKSVSVSTRGSEIFHCHCTKVVWSLYAIFLYVQSLNVAFVLDG